MRTDKFLIALRIAALSAAIVDALFVILSVLILGLFFGSIMLMPVWFGKVCLAVIIVNGAFLCVVGAYLLFRKQ